MGKRAGGRVGGDARQAVLTHSSNSWSLALARFTKPSTVLENLFLSLAIRAV